MGNPDTVSCVLSSSPIGHDDSAARDATHLHAEPLDQYVQTQHVGVERGHAISPQLIVLADRARNHLMPSLHALVGVVSSADEAASDAGLRGALGLADEGCHSPTWFHGRLHLAHGPGVPGQLRVAGEEGDALAEGLGQQQAVEGIFVQGGKPSMFTACWLVTGSSA